MKKLLFALLFITLAFGSEAQNLTHRFAYRHIITKSRIKILENLGYQITDTLDNIYHVCDANPKFRINVTQEKHVLKIEPWSILDSTYNTSTKKADPCGDNASVINAHTCNCLRIKMQERDVLGVPVSPLWLRYGTVLVGVTSVGLKVRPKITDVSGQEYAVNFISGNINIGVTAGYSFGWTKFTQQGSNNLSITPALALGFSSIKLKDEPKKVLNPDLTKNSNNLVLGPAATLTFARNDIGLILSYGYDFAVGHNHQVWAYQGKPFYGLGISLGLKL